jgi:hypothetical protein
VALTVVSFATYRTTLDGWRKADYDAHDFVKALKGESVNEYARLIVRGQPKRFDNSNRHEVVAWFGQMASDYLRERGPTPPLALVPVPSSRADRNAQDAGPSARMAAAIALEMGGGVAVRDVLRFDRQMTPSHRGGSRDVQTLLQRFDDAVVTGTHLRAAALKLGEDAAAPRISLAVCGASAERNEVENAFGLRERQLADTDIRSRGRESSVVALRPNDASGPFKCAHRRSAGYGVP